MKDKIIAAAQNLKKGETAYLGWQRGIKSNIISEILIENLPGVTFEVHETVNGYSIKSI